MRDKWRLESPFSDFLGEAEICERSYCSDPQIDSDLNTKK